MNRPRYVVAGAPTLLWIILSDWFIWTHLYYTPSREIRKHVIRISMMVPIYALSSYLPLVFTERKLVFETIRACYGALALYSCHCFLIACLGDQSVLASTRRSKPTLVRSTTIGILQYIPTKLLMAVVVLVTSLAGVYCEGDFLNPFVSYGYVCLILWISETWALYCLVLFFLGTKEELGAVLPLPKCLAIMANLLPHLLAVAHDQCA